MKFGSCLTTVALVAVLGGCAPQTQRPTIENEAVKAEELEQQMLAIGTYVELRNTLYRTYFRVATAAADFCGDKTNWRLGFLTLSLQDGAEAYRKATLARFPELSDAHRIHYIVPGSPAEKSGLLLGDEVTMLDGQAVSRDESGIVALGAKYDRTSDKPVKLDLRRNGTDMALIVTPVKACNYPVNLIIAPTLNAFADGKTVNFYKGMMEFARSEEEIALIVGHELAHNFRGHLDAQRTNAVAGQVAGTVLDVLVAATGISTGGLFSRLGGNAGGGAFSTGFESEADYAGLYTVARAGYAIDDAPVLWRRMALNSIGHISHSTTHPATAERFVALNAAIKEIKAKQASGAPLIPNEIPKSPPSESIPSESPLNMTR